VRTGNLIRFADITSKDKIIKTIPERESSSRLWAAKASSRYNPYGLQTTPSSSSSLSPPHPPPSFFFFFFFFFSGFMALLV
jgi:hypothetical protein